AEVAVVVVAECRGETRAQPEPSGRHGEVGDAAGAGRESLGPHLRAGLRRTRQPRKDEVEEHRAPHEDVDLRRAGRPTRTERVERVVRHLLPYDAWGRQGPVVCRRSLPAWYRRSHGAVMKLTTLGGGGFRVPLVYAAVLGQRATRGIREVALHDTDETR